MRNLNVLPLVRVLIGGVYLFSGTEKLLLPLENFIYAVQSYDLVHAPMLERIIAVGFPWLELVLGAFVILGIWLRLALVGIGTCSVIFILVVGQALIRRLAITECGCFGNFMSIPLPIILILDIILLALSIILLIGIKKTSAFSLDNYFSKK